MELVAAIIIIGLALAGAWFIATLVSTNETARLIVGAILGVLAVFCLWVVFDADSNTVGAATAPVYAGSAGNAGRVAPVTASAGVASNGNCDPACQMGWLGRRSGVML